VLWKPLIRIWMYDVKVINKVFTVIFLYHLLFLNNYFITLLQASSFSVHCHVAASLSVDLKLSRILSLGGVCGKMSWAVFQLFLDILVCWFTYFWGNILSVYWAGNCLWISALSYPQPRKNEPQPLFVCWCKSIMIQPCLQYECV